MADKLHPADNLNPSERDLEARLEGLFSGPAPEPDRTSPLAQPPTEEPREHRAEIEPAQAEARPGEAAAVETVPLEPVESEPPGRVPTPSAAPGIEAEGLERGRVHILNVLLGGATIGGGAGVLALLIGVIQKPARFPSYIPYFIAYSVVVAMFLLRRIPSRWRVIVLFAVTYVVALFSTRENGVVSTAPWYLFAASMLSFILIGPRAGVVTSVVHVLLFVATATAYHLGWLRVRTPIELPESLPQFLVVSTTFALITLVIAVMQWLFARAQARVTRTIREQNETLRQAQELSRTRAQDLAVANRVLQRQTAHFELGAQVGHLSTQELGTKEFVSRVVRLVLDRLNLYDVSLFLLDEGRGQAILQDYASEDALSTADRKLSLAVQDAPTLGQCVLDGQARIVSQTQDLDALPCLLPQTRSALLLPMIAQGQVIGVIVIQSQAAEAFREQDVAPLRTVADQTAVTVAYDRALVELQERLRELETMQRYYVREAWEQFLPTRPATFFQYHRSDVGPFDEGDLTRLDQVLSRLGAASADERVSMPHDLFVPIAQRGHVIGLLGVERSDRDEPLSEGQVEMVQTVSEQMELILDNARLLEEARTRAGQERKVREVAARMRESLDVESVLRTAIDQMYQTLGLEEIAVHLQVSERVPDDPARGQIGG